MNRLEIFKQVYGDVQWHESALLHLMSVVDLVEESFDQALTDPENQPSQYGTVTLKMYEVLQDTCRMQAQKLAASEALCQQYRDALKENKHE